MKDSIKKLETLFTTPQKNYEALEASVKRSMGDYRMKLEEIARKEEVRLRKIQEEEEAKQKEALAKAKAEGTPLPPPMPVAPIAVVERMDTTIKTDSGKSTAKKVIKFEVLDPDALPKKYKDLIFAKAVEKGIVETVLRPIIKVEGVNCKIAGIRVYEDFDFSVTTD